MSEYKIEKGFPIPLPCKRGKAKYPWRELEVGDSFFVAGAKSVIIASSANGFAARHPGLNFVCRQVEGGVRVWRIA